MCPVYLDVESRLDRRAVEATAREITQVFSRLGGSISQDLGRSLGRGLSAFDTSGARAQLLQLETAWRRAADVETDAARRMEAAAARATAATERYGAESARGIQAQAIAAKTQRDYADALVANEAAHAAHTKAMQDSAAAATMASRVWNGVGIASVAGFGLAVDRSTEAAAKFQQSIIKLGAAADVPTDQLKTVSDGLLRLAGQVPYTAQQLAAAFYDVAKAGYKGADGLKVLQVGAQLASVENADLSEVVNGLTTTINDFHIPAAKLAETASKINVAVGDAKTNLQAFSGSMHNIEPVASIANNQLEQVYASMARFSQSGFSMDQGTQNLAQMYRNFLGPNQQMRDAVGKLGLSMDDLQRKVVDPNVGIIGVLQILSDTVRNKTAPDGQVAIDTFYKNADATLALNQAYGTLTGKSKEFADSINNGVLPPMKQLFQQKELDPKLAQWDTERKKVEGLSSNLKKLQGNLEPIQQLWKEITGTAEGFNMASVLVGSPEALKATTDEWHKLQGVTAGANDTVRGVAETQEGLNTKMREAKAAFGAAAIEIGSAFVPTMTSAANVAKDVGDFMGKHPAIMHASVDALGALGGAWLGFKAIDVVGSLLKPIASTLGAIIAEEEGATAATAGLGRAMAGLKTAGLLGVGAQLGGQWAQDHTDPGSFWNSAAVVGTDAGTGAAAGAAIGSIIPVVGTGVGAGVGALVGGGIGLYNQIAGHAAGGPLHASGPKGKDSALFWGADGEHVLTHHEVQKMGGHSGVYAFRQALMGGTVLGRAYGGAIGPDVEAAHSMMGTAYSQSGRTDCSGMVGRVILGALGIPGSGGLPTTQNMGQWLGSLGFKPGIGGPGAISVGWYNHGSSPNDGHTAMTLSDGENAESGGSHGNFLVGPGAAGASSAQFDHHMFLPNLYGEGTGGGMPGGYSAGGFGGGGFGGGGGVPAGSRAGTGPGGQPGYYTPNPEKVASAQEQLRHIDEEIRIAEERKANLKSDASQAEKDRLNEEIKHLHAQRDREQERLAKAEQGTFHVSRGGRGMGGSPFLPVPLADKFGLDKGLPGLVEYGIGALEDLVLGPLETAAWGALGQAFGGGMPGPGDSGFGAPGLPAGLSSFTAGGSGTSSVGAPGGAGHATGGRGSFTPWWGGAGQGPNFYKQSDRLPPDFVEFARQQGWIRPDGSYAGPPLQSPPPGSLTNPKSVAPSVKMHPDLSRLGGNAKGPLPVGPPQPPGPPHTDATKNQPWFGGPGRGDTGLNVPKVWGQLQQFFDFNQPGFATGGAVPETHIPANPHQTEEDQVVRQLVPWQNPKTGLPSYTLRGKGFDDPSLMQGTHFATGGPSGTDIIPAWLSPNEHVLTSDDVDALGGQSGVYAFRNALHARYGGAVYLDDGGAPGQQNVQQQAQSGLPNVKDPGSQKQSGSAAPAWKAMLPGGQSAQGALSPMPQGPQATGMGAVTQGAQQGMANVAAAGANVQHPEDSMPASSGIGFSGGVIGGLESAASSAAGAAAGAGTFGTAGGAASSAMQIGFQELNRAAAAGAQYGGILTEGALETIMPSDSSTNWMQTIPGRLLSGIAGARPENPNTAGQTKLPVAGDQQPGGYSPTGGGQNMYGGWNGGHMFNINGDVHVKADNPQQFGDAFSDESMSMAENKYAGGFIAGRGGMNGPI